MTDLNLYIDVMCAHSYVAYPTLRAALSDLRAAGHAVTMRIQPLLIVPDAPLDDSELLTDVHRRQFGPSSRSNEEAMTRRATAAGVPIHFETTKFTSTIPALAAILQAQDRDPQLGEGLLAELFHAYFVDGAIISDLEWLAAFCDEHGATDIQFVDEQFDRVREASQAARRTGITSAPTLKLPSGSLIIGGQQRQEYTDLIEHDGA